MKIKFTAKKIFSALLLLLVFNTGAMAQDKLAERAKVLTDNMKTKLTLTDEQYKKLYDVNVDFLTKSGEIKKTELEKTEKAKQFRALTGAKDANIKTIVTPEQYAIYLEAKKGNRSKLQEVTVQNKIDRLEKKEEKQVKE